MTDKVHPPEHPPTYYVVVTDNNSWGRADNLPEAIENACGGMSVRCFIYIVPMALWNDYSISHIDGGVTLTPSDKLMTVFSETERRQIMDGTTLLATCRNGKLRFYPDLKSLENAPV